MSSLFDPITIGNLTLPNRVIMAPMTRSRADEAGVPSEFASTYYSQRASAGLIVTEATNVSAMAKGYINTPGMFTEAQLAGWRVITEAVHAKGGRIFAQLFHTGRIALPDHLPGQVRPVAPSPIAAVGKNYTMTGPKDFVTPRPLETEEVAGVAAEFGAAARNALAAGFDGVELHSASGYLIQQFLDAAANQRSDRYGGAAENRAGMLLEVIDAMIDAAGHARVGIKLSPQIAFNSVVEPDAEIVYTYLVPQLSRRNIAYLHVARTVAFDWHATLRPLFDGPYFAGAGFDLAAAEALLAVDGADAIVFGKYFVSNPDLPELLRARVPLAEPDTSTYYSGGAKGYIDYSPVAA